MLFAAGALAQTTTTPPDTTKPAAATAPVPAKSAAPQTADTAPAVPQTPDAAKPVETFQSAMAKQRAAIAKQLEAVRQQREMVVPWQTPPSGTDSPFTDCDPIPDPELTPLITRAAQEHQMEPKLIRGVIEQESGFHACATSAKGAKGLMQLMPATIEQFKVVDAFDPTQNVEAGARYLKQLLDRYKGDLKLALAAYNAGPANVDKTGGIPDIKETQDYVESIMKKMR
jgi:soluble lytic murein transglycosylase-like protein